MANLDRLNAALDAIGTVLDSIIDKVTNLGSANDAALAEVADKADAIKAQVDELDALVTRPAEPTPTETPGDVTPTA